jgi:hypothetical protein
MSTNQGNATAKPDPTAPVRPAEAAAELVHWADQLRAHTAAVPALSLPAAEALVKGDLERGRLPHRGHGDGCRIGRDALTPWLLGRLTAMAEAAAGGV